MIAAERETVRMYEAAVAEHRKRRRAGTEVDHRGADVGLIIGQR